MSRPSCSKKRGMVALCPEAKVAAKQELKDLPFLWVLTKASLLTSPIPALILPHFVPFSYCRSLTKGFCPVAANVSAILKSANLHSCAHVIAWQLRAPHYWWDKFIRMASKSATTVQWHCSSVVYKMKRLIWWAHQKHFAKLKDQISLGFLQKGDSPPPGLGYFHTDISDQHTTSVF